MTKLLQDLNLGTNLKLIRNSRKMTQEDVCVQLSLHGRPMSQSTYAQIESGRRNIFLSDLIALKDVFGVSYDDFFQNLRPINKYDTTDDSDN